MKIGLALSGGGVLGAAHLGAIEQIEANNIKIDYVCGSSVGAIIGMVYCSGGLKKLNNFVDEVKGIKFIENRKLVFLPGPESYFEQIRKILQKYVPQKDFADFKIPFSCVATNIQTGRLEVFASGDPIEAVMASASYPGVFSPQEISGKLYTDGGVARNLPSDIVRRNADFVIGSSIYDINILSRAEVKYMSRLRVLKRTLDIMEKQQSDLMARECDFCFKPNVDSYSWYEFHKVEKIREVGRVCAKEHVGELIKKLSGVPREDGTPR